MLKKSTQWCEEEWGLYRKPWAQVSPTRLIYPAPLIRYAGNRKEIEQRQRQADHHSPLTFIFSLKFVSLSQPFDTVIILQLMCTNAV